MDQESAVKALLEACAYEGDSDPIECAIMKLPGFDFDVAHALVGTVFTRLLCRYELDRHEQFADMLHHFAKFQEALRKAEEPEPDPKWDEDMNADDPRRL